MLQKSQLQPSSASCKGPTDNPAAIEEGPLRLQHGGYLLQVARRGPRRRTRKKAQASADETSAQITMDPESQPPSTRLPKPHPAPQSHQEASSSSALTISRSQQVSVDELASLQAITFKAASALNIATKPVAGQDTRAMALTPQSVTASAGQVPETLFHPARHEIEALEKDHTSRTSNSLAAPQRSPWPGANMPVASTADEVRAHA